MMKNCGNCANYDRTKKEHTDACGTCISGRDHGESFGPTNWKPLPMTNADQIRAMSDEELVEFINHFNICDLRTNEECKMSYCACCEVCVMDWLRQPAEVSDDAN